MKILALTAFYPPHHSGGYELRCSEVLEGLKEKGHSIVVLTTRYPHPKCTLHPFEEGINRILHLRQDARSVFTQIRWDCMDLRYIDKFVKQYAPDLIYLWHIQNLSNAILPYFSSRSIPIVYDEGGSGLIHLFRVYQRGLYFYKNEEDRFLKKLLKEWVYKISRFVSFNLINPEWHWPENMRIYFNSNASKNNTLSHGVEVNQAAVIPSGIDIRKFPFQNHNRPGNPIKIIVPSRIKKEKGIQDVVCLALKLREKGISAEITIVGKVQSFEYYSEIQQSIRENGIGNAITFSAMVDQEHLSRLYRDNDFCFFPSYFKSGFSRVPLEAMASGCPVISYGNEGCGEIIQDWENGFVVEEGNVNAAADIIDMLISKPEVYQTVTFAARRMIEQKFEMTQYVCSVETFLLECKAETNA